jgi:ubiquinone/menaquinone biosynthesis C-methylase UbiE
MEKQMSLYATPRIVHNIEDCYFYHTIELPGYGTIKGNWDLREGLNAYLGNVEFANKRVLDVGTGSGIISFAVEARGATVTSFDLSEHDDWDMVPFSKWQDYEHITKDRKRIIERLKNSYWLSHRALNSNAKVVYGSTYNIPVEIGVVDISIMGCILLHLRDPFLALQNAARITKETVVVTEVFRGHPMNSVERMMQSLQRFLERTLKLRVNHEKSRVGPTEPYMVFLPDAGNLEPKDTWWSLRPETIRRMLGVLGFEDTTVGYHYQAYEGNRQFMFTVVAKRTSGRPLEAPPS